MAETNYDASTAKIVVFRAAGELQEASGFLAAVERAFDRLLAIVDRDNDTDFRE